MKYTDEQIEDALRQSIHNFLKESEYFLRGQWEIDKIIFNFLVEKYGIESILVDDMNSLRRSVLKYLSNKPLPTEEERNSSI